MHLSDEDVLYLVQLCIDTLMGKRKEYKQNVKELSLAASPNISMIKKE